MIPYYDHVGITIYHGDCLEIMPTLADKSVDVVIADPPYGCGKAEWDGEFPTKWYREAIRVGHAVVIITGSSGLFDSIPLVGDDFVDVISAWNKNGMTRGPIGYGNWIAAVVAGRKPKMGQNFFSFSVSGEKPNHPSPKPIEYMNKLIERITKPGDTVLDPFAGSGTTGVACLNTGRKAILIERKEKYCEIAVKRLQQEVLPL